MNTNELAAVGSDPKVAWDMTLAIATTFLALATFWLGWVTRGMAKDATLSTGRVIQQSKLDTEKLVRESQDATKKQISVQTWLEFKRTYESPRMRDARGLLATKVHFHQNKQNYFREVGEPVLEFFEDLAILYSLGYIDAELTRGTFSFAATRWWAALKDDIEAERYRHQDNRICSHFESFAAKMLKPSEQVTEQELVHFIREQTDLSHSPRPEPRSGLYNAP